MGSELEAFDPFAPGEERKRRLFELLAQLKGAARSRCDAPAAATLLSPDFELDLTRVRALLELQSDHVIAIGE